MKTSVRSLIAGSLSACAAFLPLHAQVVDTRTGPTDGYYVLGTRQPGLAEYFTAPTGATALSNFEFFLGARGPNNRFSARIYNPATSEILFTSGIETVSENYDFVNFPAFLFATPGLLVSAGTQYAALLTYEGPAADADPADLLVSLQRYNEEARSYVFHDGVPYHSNNDLNFRAEFSSEAIEVLPEPSSFALFGTGIVGFLVVGSRRRRNARA